MGKHSAIINDMQNISSELAGLGNDVQPVVDAVAEKFNEVERTSGQKQTEFATIRQTLIDNEKLCTQFAEEAENFYSFLEQEKRKDSQDDDLAATIRVLGSISDVLQSAGSESLQNLETLDQQMKERKISENKHTSLSLRSLRTTYDSLLASIKKKLDAANKQLLAGQQTGISSEEFADIKDSFDHFDQDHDGKLNALDLFGVLSFLGEQPTEESAAALLTELDKDGDGKLGFDEYKDYIVAKRADRDTLDTYLESFNIVAGNKDFVTESDLRRLMPGDRVDFLLSVMPRYGAVEDGYDYKKWLHNTYGLNL
jgi:Ca2+-binding EF-hand superfamily protein